MKKTLFLASLFALLALSVFAQVVTGKEKQNIDTADVNTKILGKNEISTNIFMLGYNKCCRIEL